MKKLNRPLISIASVALLLMLLFLRRDHRPEAAVPSQPAAFLSAPLPVAHLSAQTAPPLPPSPSAPAAATRETSVEPDRFLAFNSWAEDYLNAPTPAARASLLAAGEQLAKARRGEMARLIKSDPQRALDLAVSYRVRKEMPANITGLLEQPVSGRGNYSVIYYSPRPDWGSDAPPDFRRVTVNHQTYDAFIYGRRLQQRSQSGLSLHGVAVDKFLALSADPVRVLEPEEAADVLAAKHAKINPACAVCGQKPPTGAKPILAEFGGKIVTLCQASEVGVLNKTLSEAELKLSPDVPARRSKTAATSAVSPTGAPGLRASVTAPSLQPALSGPAVTNLPPEDTGPLPHPQGRKRLLLMPVLFVDDPTPPASIDSIYALAEANNKYYVEGSYNTASFDTTVTPYLRLPEKKIYYGEFLDIGFLLYDAAITAQSLGYDLSFYDFGYVLFTSIAGVTFGGRSDGLLVGGGGAISHELGHNFGLAHANFWDTRGNRPPPAQPPAPAPPFPIDPDSLIGHDDINAPANDAAGGKNPPDEEYGDIFDVMGSGSGHFSAVSKYALNWLPGQFTRVVTRAETNRVYAFDTPGISAGHTYALRIRKDFERTYWASYRQGIPSNPWLSSGIELTWGPWSGTVASAQLLDTTPGTVAGKNDAAVVIGRTFADPQANMYLTPVAKGTDSKGEKWVDVVLQFGPFPTNLPPVLALSASQLTVPRGGTVTFTATADDPNGDPLAYYWDFGDQTFGANSPVNPKTFFNDGQFVVRCEVSDMRGGVASAFAVVVVGSPTNFTMSGRVVDTFGNGLQGVRVHNSGSLPPYVAPDPYNPPPPPTNGTYRYSFTDSQGYYTIGNIPPGTYTNRAFIYGYRTDPITFEDPVVLTTGDAFNLDHLATPLTKVSIAAPTNAFEGQSKPGAFTISRAGSTNLDLPVRFLISGTAIQGVDYVGIGSVTTNGSGTNATFVTNLFGSVVIPAGRFSTNLFIAPVDDSNGTGPKTVVLTLQLQTNDFRITSSLTNVVSTNTVGTNMIVVTNTLILYATNLVSIPGWELLPLGPDSQLTWFQTYPTYVLGTAEASLTINDNDPPAVPRVSVFAVRSGQLTAFPNAKPDTDAIETGNDSATVTFVRIGGSVEASLVINYTISGTASNGVDYQRLSGSVTIPAGERGVNLPITASNDLFVEGNETVDVSILDDRGGTYSVATRTAEVLIVEDDLPLISVYSSDSTALKTGSVGTVTIEREGDLAKDLLVNYLVTGTAISGLDYQALNGSVVIPAGQITATITIRPLNSANPPPLTVTVLLSASTTYNISSLDSQATVTILDQLPFVTVTTNSPAVGEAAAGPGVFNVVRTGSTNASLLVNFLVGGSAIEGADYSALPRSVTIPAGATNATLQVLPVNDKFNEFGDVSGNDTVLVQIAPGPGYALGNPSSATLTILDDDPLDLPAVGFLLSQSSGREDDGAAFLDVRISANPTNTRSPALIDYKITSGTALAGIDYDYIGTQTLSFVHYTAPTPPPQFHQTENSIQTIVIPLINDGTVRGDRFFTVTLFPHVGYITNLTTNMNIISTNLVQAPTNCYVGDYRSHTFTIRDVGDAVVDLYATTPYAYEEGTVPGVFTVSRTGSTAKALTVKFAVSGTASSGSDYVPFGNSVTIPAGTNAATLNVVPNDDSTEEIPETVIVTLLDGPGFTIGNGRDSVIIVDNDGTIQFSFANYSVSEGDGTASIAVQRSGDTNLLVTVDYLVYDGTARSGLDYTAANGRLTFNPGEVVQTFPIQIINDIIVEPTETVNLVLTNATGGVPLGGQYTATLSIVDDDSAFVFATGNFRVNENGAPGGPAQAGTNALISINRLGLTNTALSVTFWTTDGSATNGRDYRGVTNTLNFAAGDTNKTVLVPILDDALLEGDETVVLHLTNVVAGSLIGGSDTATLTIVDDECALQFAAAAYSVDEYAGFVNVIVQRAGGTINPVSVRFQTRDGTAIGTGSNNLDFVAQSGTLLFQGDQYLLATNGSGILEFHPGETNQTITIPIIDDNLGEGNETFSVILSSPTGPAAPRSFTNSTVLGVPTNALVTIIDNETPGNVDPDFNPGLGPNDRVRVLALQADLRIVFGGDFTTVDGIVYNRIARWQPNGNLDNTFNPGAGADGMIDAVAIQPDTKIMIGGAFANVDSVGRANIARLNADGNLDLSFDPGAGPNKLVRAIAVQPNGKVLIGGDFTQIGSTPRSRLARLNTNGTLDVAFSPSVSDSVYALALQPDGQILLGGAFTTIGATASPFVARLNTNGTVDASFKPGTGANGTVTALALQNDGSIVLGGKFTAFNGTNLNYVARLTPAGDVDAGFNPGSGANAAVNSVAVHPNGKIILGGDFTLVNGSSRNHFARLNPDGSLDGAFSIRTGANATVRAVAVQPDTAVLIGGDFTQVENRPRNYIARIHGEEKSDLSSVGFSAAAYNVSEGAGAATITVVRSGNTNRAFSVSFGTTNGTATPLADYFPTNGVLNFTNGDLSKTFTVGIIDDTLIEDNETIYLFLTNAPLGVDLSGISTAVLTILDNEKSVRFSSANYLVDEGATNGIVTLLRVGAVTGAVSVTFSTTDGSAQAGLDYAGVTNVVNFSAGQSNQTVLIPIIDDSLTEGAETINLMLSNPMGDVQIGQTNSLLTILDNEPSPGGVDPGFNPGVGANNFVRSLALQPDGKVLVGGGFTIFDNVSRNYIARLNTNGTHDLTFDPGTGADALVSSVSSLSDGRAVVAGAFTNLNGVTYNHVARLMTNGSADPNFIQSAGFDAAVNAVAVRANGRILAGGGFSLPNRDIIQLLPSGSVDSTFSPGDGADGPIHCVLVQSSGQVILGGAFRFVSDFPRSRVARLNGDGSLDFGFSPTAITNGAVYCAALQTDGKVIVGGDFYTTNRTSPVGLARLNQDGSLDSTFNPGSGANAAVFAVAVQATGKILVGGSFTTFNNTSRNRYARLNRNGSVDTAFDPGAGANSTVYSVLLLPDSNFLIGGDFTAVNGVSRNRIARIKADDLGPKFLSIVFTPGNPPQMTLMSQGGRTYILEASQDLINWAPVRTNTAVGSTLILTDPTNPALQRFYRVREL